MGLLERLIHGGPRPTCKCGKKMLPLRRGVPIFVCPCGAMKIGKNTVTLDGTLNLGIWSASGTPTALGHLGMDLATGRPRFFRAGAARDVVGTDEIPAGGGFQLVSNQTFAVNTQVITFGGLAGTPDGAYIAYVSSSIGVGADLPLWTVNAGANPVLLVRGVQVAAVLTVFNPLTLNALSGVNVTAAQTFSAALYVESKISAHRRNFLWHAMDGSVPTATIAWGEIDDATAIASLELRFAGVGRFGNPTHASLYKFGS